ncbi:Peptidyl-prolyl cis-trans isomerase CWC27 like protein [Eufriesea mexicana]|uniref:Spliceosome-associated protein CWC27 homolog n=1 Tax=Eufriesea mexicana TaxID=516756 RepID=A0A310S998_9HYME|nr:Peptidyl-prolyl cis-trans isomerase CWC27 like protein [Eufriesea mexicana]
MRRNIYGNLETIKAARIMVLWHIMDFNKPMSKEGKRRLTNMNNIYIQGPPTMAKVTMKTTIDDIKLELWAKETPKACRNFIQLCVEGYYHDPIFHTQGGNPTGTGESGKIYGGLFKDEFHTRLRFCQRDLFVMAYAGKDDNNSQFFFTLGSTPDLQNKHTIFGNVTGETIYNMLNFEEALVDENDRSLYPSRLIKTIILNNPFADIPRIIVQEEFSLDSIILYNEKFCYKDFNLLSFGEAAEEDEEESVMLNRKFSDQGKSARDHLTDSKLSSEPAVVLPGLANKKRKEDCSNDWESDDEGSYIKGTSRLLRSLPVGAQTGHFGVWTRRFRDFTSVTLATFPRIRGVQLALAGALWFSGFQVSSPDLIWRTSWDASA